MVRESRTSGQGPAWSRIGCAAATLAVVLAAAGCGSSDSTAGATHQHKTGTDASSAAHTTGPAPDTVNIMASEWAFQISGDAHAGLVELHVNNVGEATHEIGLVRVKDGVSLDQVKQALKRSEAAAHALQAAPNEVITSAAIAGPHVNEHVVVPLEAGHYIVTSFLPGPGGAPQVASGMIGEFTVQPAAASAPVAPKTDGTVELSDTGIKLPGGFAKGGTFEVTNTGTKPHDFSVAQLKGQPLPAYFQCVGKSFGTGTSVDQCPGVLQGGVTTMQPGEKAYVTLVFGPGKFGYVSTEGNGADFKAGLNGTFSGS